MTRAEQRKLLKDICNRVRDELLTQSARWPEDWNGHDLRELVAYAHDSERTRLMREDRNRRAAVVNEVIVNRLF